ncbi:RING finger protein 24-like [Acropora palmata]|uniref:RING finger protein 24-like n=1 Tax=Acropora palmata TaxID=6131 RepID=UPI003DA017B2
MTGRHSSISESILFLLPILFISFLVVGLCLVFCCYLLRANEDFHCQSEFRRRPTHVSGLRTTSYRKKWLASFSLKSDTCAICLDDFHNKEDISICRCGHAYHCKCIMEWMEIKETCPICQHNYRQKNEIQNGERAPLLFNIDL